MFKRWWWVFLVTAMIGPVLGFAVAAVVTYVMPKKYESEVTVEVLPRAAEMSSPGADAKPVSPQFFGTEFEKIKRSDSLGKVVDRLELVNRWMVDKETAVRILKGIVSTQNIGGTDLISIRVRHTNKMDARDIAKAVADCYKEYRLDLEKSEGARLLEKLGKAVKEQEVEVDLIRKVLATIPIPPKEKPDVDHGVIRRWSDPDYGEAKKEYDADQALLQTLKLKLINADIANKIAADRVMIHDEPVISHSPVSPNVTLNLVLGTVLGFLISPLFALPLMVVLNRLFPAKTSG